MRRSAGHAMPPSHEHGDAQPARRVSTPSPTIPSRPGASRQTPGRACWARALLVIGALATAPNGALAPSSALAERALRLKGMSADSLHRKWRRLPQLGGYVDADHRSKFPLSKVEQYIRTLSQR